MYGCVHETNIQIKHAADFMIKFTINIHVKKENPIYNDYKEIIHRKNLSISSPQRKSHTSWRFLIDGNDSGRSTLLGSTKSDSGTLLGPQKTDKKSSLRASMAAPPVKVGSYKGTIVSVKILTKKNLDINLSLKKQLYIRKEMTHDNINRFIGMSVESPHLYIVTQYCARGSLKVGFD